MFITPIERRRMEEVLAVLDDTPRLAKDIADTLGMSRALTIRALGLAVRLELLRLHGGGNSPNNGKLRYKYSRK